MKRKIFGGLIVLAIAAMAAFNVNMNIESSDMSDLSLANVEALAQSEGSVKIPCCPSALGSKCTFNFTNGQGQTGTMTIDNHYKC